MGARNITDKSKQENVIITKIASKAFNSFRDKFVAEHYRIYDESFFRDLFIDSLIEANPNCLVEKEHQRYDLIFKAKKDTPIILVEFKFYLTRRSIITGKPKGGAGKKNFQEFLVNIDKLRKCKNESTFLILVYGDSSQDTNLKRYSDFYGAFKSLHRKKLTKDQFFFELKVFSENEYKTIPKPKKNRVKSY